MASAQFLKIGITCYPSVGGSGILASILGEELARRGHEVHFISYGRPFRMPAEAPRVYFHPVEINDYELFKYPDYTLPLSVKMAEVTREHGLDLLHVHYAVPHATAAILARDMLPTDLQPKVVTTLHGTDTTLLGRDPGYGPAIRHALSCSDAVTTVSNFLRRETIRVLKVERPIEVIYNFFEPKEPKRSREAVRKALGLGDEVLLLHASNLRPVKRIDLLLETMTKIVTPVPFKLLVMAGGDFAPFLPEVQRLGLENRIIVRENVTEIEDYLQAADVGLFTSEMESFCLSLLEAMCFGCPSVSTAVGGIPEVAVHEESGLLYPFGDADALAAGAKRLIEEPASRSRLGGAAKARAKQLFSADAIVPQYEALYRRVCGSR
ncbi:N-acetyl-alpha-D-glucosaminyl L-malate synthase BshA [Opitutaceae bacterium EW11]|nr:N-acetyl-alpha-D-glucosaminyl L-malate synthase BshA [Opitutaceae bacterium EW11]